MSSPQKIEANRANGQLSHGPLTDATKQISSRNAVKHGFTGKTVYVSQEELERYNAHVIGIYEHHQPVGAHEKTLCQQLADLHWTLHQISVDQMNASALLDDMFVTLRAMPETNNPLTVCARLQPQHRVMNNLGIYEQRKRRAAVLVENQLRAMQKERFDKMPKPPAKPEAAKAASADKAPEIKPKACSAAVSSHDGGFVHSTSDFSASAPAEFSFTSNSAPQKISTTDSLLAQLHKFRKK